MYIYGIDSQYDFVLCFTFQTLTRSRHFWVIRAKDVVNVWAVQGALYVMGTGGRSQTGFLLYKSTLWLEGWQPGNIQVLEVDDEYAVGIRDVWAAVQSVKSLIHACSIDY